MKKLYRKQSNRMICGICSGMSEYFNIDVSIIRLAWIIFGCMGVGVIAYLIAAIVIPSDIGAQ